MIPLAVFGGDVRVMCESCGRAPAARAVAFGEGVAPFLVCDLCAPVVDPRLVHEQLGLDEVSR